MLVQRHMAAAVRAALKDTRVVLIQGARQAGKSTLAEQVLRGARSPRLLTLDDESTLAAALSDPTGFVGEGGGTVFIDEIQRAPELALAIKAAVDRDPRPGRFLLTGSAQVLMLPRLADTLAGRMEIVELWPFSQGEIGGARERFCDLLLGSNDEWPTGRLSRSEYLELVIRGGYPEVVARPSPSRRSRWFDAYVTTVVARDIKDMAEIERLDDLRRILSLVAARSGSLLNMEALSMETGIPRTSLRRYVAMLEAAFIISRVPPWSNNRARRVVRTPKVFMRDSGLAAHLLGMSRSVAMEHDLGGSMVETFAVMEVARQIGWSESHPSLLFLRTRDGTEVDAVLEAPDGRVAGVEIRLASTVRDRDFSGLRFLASRVGRRFAGGCVLYTGREPLRFGPSLWALPLSALWDAGT